MPEAPNYRRALKILPSSDLKTVENESIDQQCREVLRLLLLEESPGVELDVLLHETRDEVVGVIVARLHPDPEQWVPQSPVAVATLSSGLRQVLRLQLPG